MEQILGIGNALVDVVTLIDNDNILEKFNLPKGSMQLVDSAKSEMVKAGTENFNRSFTSGGSAANTIHGLAMVGIKTGFIGSIGKDDLGDFFENEMKNAGIYTILSRRDSVTGTAVALISPDSERTFATHLGAAVELNVNDLVPENFQGYDILYMEGYLIINRPLVEKACMLAKEKKMKIAIDLASYNVVEAKLDDFKEIVEKYVDIVFANEEEAKSFTGMGTEEALNHISKFCEIVIIKAGSEGSFVKRGEEIIKIGTDKVNVKDTTGAGDLYAAGFLFGYANGMDIEKCGILGSLMAGKVIEIIGARMNESKFEEIRAAIKTIVEQE
ncbi:MAG: adenosine kinase [Bacteroidetes bacterium]|nr:MAG: adenosine kinase [Bacteroidota bacterium]